MKKIVLELCPLYALISTIVSIGFVVYSAYSVSADELPSHLFQNVDYYSQQCDLSKAVFCHDLGIMYFEGIKVPKNMTKASYYLEKACELKESSGCLYAGHIYDLNEEVEDKLTAVLHYFKACDMSNAMGCYLVGVRSGELTKQERPEFLEKSCGLGHGKSCYLVGDFYKFIKGDLRDKDIAIDFYTRSCRRGYRSFPAEDKSILELFREFHDVPENEKKLRSPCKLVCEFGDLEFCPPPNGIGVGAGIASFKTEVLPRSKHANTLDSIQLNYTIPQIFLRYRFKKGMSAEIHYGQGEGEIDANGQSYFFYYDGSMAQKLDSTEIAITQLLFRYYFDDFNTWYSDLGWQHIHINLSDGNGATVGMTKDSMILHGGFEYNIHQFLISIFAGYSLASKYLSSGIEYGLMLGYQF